jgi:cytochrome c
MKLLLVSIAGAAFVATGAAHAQSAEELLKKHGCTVCHATDKKIVGPAYIDVAAKYKGDPKAPAMLMEKVKKGGVGNWGPPPIPMPPNDKVPDADIKAMVTYVLSLKK